LRIIHYGGASVGPLPIGRGGRAVECTGLENFRTESRARRENSHLRVPYSDVVSR
jgi:hypothetical protein